MGGVVIVVAYAKASEIGQMVFAHLRNHVFRADAFFLRCQHHWRAVGIVGTHVITLMAAHFLETHPHVGLDVFDHVA